MYSRSSSLRRVLFKGPHQRPKRWSSTIRYSIFGSGKKQDLIDQLSRDAPRGSADQTYDAVVVLASRSYAKWLTEKDFMTRLLDSIGSPWDGANGRDLNVLTAAVDHLLPEDALMNPRDGLSICRGNFAELLPGLWEGGIAAAPKASKAGGPEATPRAALTFHPGFFFPAEGLFKRRQPMLTCTLPLANTIFHNNRPFTLLASRWHRATPGARLEMSKMVSKQTQEVHCGNAGRKSSSAKTAKTAPGYLFATLGPITEPRMIVAGLGNIVRQVDVDGVTTPASKELEKVLPRFRDVVARGIGLENGDEDGSAPPSVWALVVPPAAATPGNMAKLREMHEEASELMRKEAFNLEEAKEWQRMADRMTETLIFLLSRGARILHVVSGGGGWGAKQGLLSLDPDAKFKVPGSKGEEGGESDEDLENFIRAFKGESNDHGAAYNEGESSSSSSAAAAEAAGLGSLVSPGSIIQFLSTPSMGIRMAKPSHDGAGIFSRDVAFGVSHRGAADLNPPAGGVGGDGQQSWKLVQGSFGAVSSECMYVSTGADGGELQTKMTSPDSFMCAAVDSKGGWGAFGWLPLPMILSD